MIDLTPYASEASDIKPVAADVPAGEYHVRIVGAEERENPNSGNPYLSLNLKIVGGEYDRRHLFDDLYLTPAAAPYTLAKIQTFGGKAKFDPEDLVGLEAVAVYRLEKPRDGYQQRLKVVGYNPLPEAARDPLAAPAPAPAAGQPKFEDDLPFAASYL